MTGSRLTARLRFMRRGDDRGSMIPLVLGFFVLAALLIFGAVTASTAFLAQRDLAAVCDGAAVAAAQSVNEGALYAAGPVAGTTDGQRLPLDLTAVEAAVARYVGVGGYGGDPDGLTVSGSVGGDGTTAVVRCTRTVQIPFGAVYGYPDGLPRSAVSSARSPVLPPL